MILDKVVPNVPLPDNIRLIGPNWLDLDDMIWPQLILGHFLRVSTRLNRLFLTLGFPSNHEKITIWQGFDIMVATLIVANVVPFPFHLTIPR